MTNPYGNDLLVDQVIGSAYQVVKYVAANMEYLIDLSEFISTVTVEGIIALIEAIPELTELHTNLTELLAIHASLPELLALEVNLPMLTVIYDMLPELQEIYDNLPAILDSSLSVATSREAIVRSYNEAGYPMDKTMSFEAGGTITTAKETLLYEQNGVGYSWGGVLPKVVPAGSTPATTGGIGPTTWIDQSTKLLRQQLTAFSGNLTTNPEWADIPANSDPELGGPDGPMNGQAKGLAARTELLRIQVREELRRSYAEAGLNLRPDPESFKNGGTLMSAYDVLLEDLSGKAYSGTGPFPQTVTADTNPVSGGFTDRSGELLRLQLPASKYFAGVAALKTATGLAAGDKVCTGKIYWDIGTVARYNASLALPDDLYAYPSNAINLLDFGADRNGVDLINTALNDAADVGPVYCPPGIYRVENFTRRLQPGNSNVGQERLVVYGDLTPQTSLHQYMVASTIFEGDGDLFKSVVNYAFANVGVRNKSLVASGLPTVPGALFSMYGKGLEAGVWMGCYFGACNRHFQQVAAGGIPTIADDYMIGPFYDACAFFHSAQESRYFDGTVANYNETGKCYTAHCKKGLYMKSPGPGAGLTSTIFEYIDDEAIVIDAYGFVANYSFNMDRVFVESCGGDLGVICGVTKPEKAKAIPSIKIQTASAGGAKIRFSHKNCFATYTGANPPVAHFLLPASTTSTVEMSEDAFSNGLGVAIYSSSPTVATDPFLSTNGLFRIENGVVNAKGLVIGHGASLGNAPLDVTATADNVLSWMTSPFPVARHVLVSTSRTSEYGNAADGFYFSENAGSKDCRITDGHFWLDKNGKGIKFKTPSGTVKTLTISDAGEVVIT